MATYDGFFTPENWFQRVVLFVLFVVVIAITLPFLVGAWLLSLFERRSKV